MALFYIFANLIQHWILIFASALQPGAMSLITELLENSAVLLWENESEKGK